MQACRRRSSALALAGVYYVFQKCPERLKLKMCSQEDILFGVMRGFHGVSV